MKRAFWSWSLTCLGSLLAVACGTGTRDEGIATLQCITDPRDIRYGTPTNAEACAFLNPDGGVDAGDGGPGTDPQACEPTYTCIENAPDGFEPPRPVWIGPSLKAPLECPPSVGAFGSLNYFDLQAEPLSCPECVCGDVKGSCSPNPGQILIRAASCSEPIAYTTDFNASASWDGSCTSEKSLPAGAMCPTGLCAQSIYVSALPDPVEGCEPIPLPTPSAKGFPYWWAQTALSCGASEAAPDWTCVDPALRCDYKLPPGWRHCVRREGLQECPSGSKYGDRFVVYPRDAVDDYRGCSPCSCKASGGTCYGTFRAYQDEACAQFLYGSTWSSEDILCGPVIPAGTAIGSKEITNLHYAPGVCKSSGGFPFGKAEPIEADAVTWCCMAPESAPTE